MSPVEAVPGMGGKEDGGEWWKGEFKYDTFDMF
jgi:hypothetical protein